MPAGAAQMAFSEEGSFNGSLVSSTDWHQPGTNITVSGPNFERNQTRNRQPDDPRPRGSHPGNAVGSATVEFTLTGAKSDQNWHDQVFADGGTALLSTGAVAPSAQWYFSSDLVGGSTDRITTGTVVTDAEIVWTQAEDVRVSLTLAYADEPDSTSAPSDSDITQPSVDNVYAFHGADIDVGSTYQTLLSSLTLSLSSLARMRYGQSQIADSAVTAGYELSLSTDATFTETDQLTRALSGRSSGALVDETTATIPFTNAAGDTIEYSVSGAQPNSVGWSDLVNTDSDLSEALDYHVTNVGVV
jgi:hypothetical protein